LGGTRALPDRDVVLLVLFPLAAGGAVALLRTSPSRRYWFACAGLAAAFCALSPWVLSFADAGFAGVVVGLAANFVLPVAAAFAVRSWAQKPLVLFVVGAVTYLAALFAGITVAVNLGLVSH
jgi:hypothetical protein